MQAPPDKIYSLVSIKMAEITHEWYVNEVAV